MAKLPEKAKADVIESVVGKLSVTQRARTELQDWALGPDVHLENAERNRRAKMHKSDVNPWL